jgi:hypothetical protein
MSEAPSILFRLRYRQQGGHTHIRVFAGTSPYSLGKAGDLVFRNEERDVLRPKLAALPDVECLPEGE